MVKVPGVFTVKASGTSSLVKIAYDPSKTSLADLATHLDESTRYGARVP